MAFPAGGAAGRECAPSSDRRAWSASVSGAGSPSSTCRAVRNPHNPLGKTTPLPRGALAPPSPASFAAMIASLQPAAWRATGLAERRASQAPCPTAPASARALHGSVAPVPAVAQRRQPSRRGPAPARAEGGGPAQTAAALLQTAQSVPDQVAWHQATVVENRWEDGVAHRAAAVRCCAWAARTAQLERFTAPPPPPPLQGGLGRRLGAHAAA